MVCMPGQTRCWWPCEYWQRISSAAVCQISTGGRHARRCMSIILRKSNMRSRRRIIQYGLPMIYCMAAVISRISIPARKSMWYLAASISSLMRTSSSGVNRQPMQMSLFRMNTGSLKSGICLMPISIPVRNASRRLQKQRR